MTVTEFKRIISALSTYATVREKATGPESYIGVQARNEVLRLIAGNSTGGIVVTAGIGDIGEGVFAIKARPFLNAGKTLTGKLNLGFKVSPDGLELTTDKGGSAVFANEVKLSEVGLAKKPKSPVAFAFVKGDAFSQLAKVLDATQRDIEANVPTIDFYDGKAVVTGVDPISKTMYATVTLDASGEEVHGAAYMDFWRAMKVFTEDGTVELGEDGMIARSGIYEVFSSPWKISPWNKKTRTSEAPRWPTPHPQFGFNDESVQARVTIDRRVLIDSVKGQQPDEELSRVTLQIDAGTFKVYPYGAEAGYTLPAATEGRGIRSVQGPLMLDVLRAFESKEVVLAWGNPSPAIRVGALGYDNWVILLAPVTMSR